MAADLRESVISTMRYACRSVRHIYQIRLEEPLYRSLFPPSSTDSTTATTTTTTTTVSTKDDCLCSSPGSRCPFQQIIRDPTLTPFYLINNLLCLLTLLYVRVSLSLALSVIDRTDRVLVTHCALVPLCRALHF